MRYTIAFDKTGTLTYGSLEVCDIIPFEEKLDEAALLSMAASAESRSEHPLGKAISACAEKRGIPVAEPDTFSMTAGKGVCARVEGKTLLCGNETFLSDYGVTVDRATSTTLERLRAQGKASILVAEGNRCIGVVAMSDVLRPEAGDIVKRLHDMETNIVLLTGDNQMTADHFASQVDIRQVRAGCSRRKRLAASTISKMPDGRCVWWEMVSTMFLR